ncbi:MAG: tetratricopeptide repeat protein, partial [Nitrospinota bacterium]
GDKVSGEDDIYRSDNRQVTAEFKGSWERPGQDYKWIPLWTQDSSMLIPRGSPAAVAVNGYVYVMGGGDLSEGNNIIYATVEYAKIKSDGSLGKWKMTSPMTTKRIFASAVSAYGYVYVLGGEKGYASEDLLDTVERAKILPDGSLGNWELLPSVMNTQRRALTASVHEGWMYAFGGFNGAFLSDIERAKVQPDGSVGEWIYESEESRSKRYIHSGLIHRNYVYLFGGHVRNSSIGTDAVEWTTILPSGELEAWKELSPMQTKRIGGGAIVVKDTVYVVGGQNTISLSAVERAQVRADGTLTEWVADTPLSDSRVGPALASDRDVIYVIGGFRQGAYLNEVLRGYYVKGKPLGTWSNSPQFLAFWDKTKDLIPLDAENHFKLAWQHLTQKEYDSAIKELNLGLKIKSNLPDPYNLLGAAYHEKEMFDKAIENYETALKLSPGDGRIYLNIGGVRYKMGEIGQAEKMFREAVKYSPDFQPAWIKLFSLLSETGRCEELKGEVQKFYKSYGRVEAVEKLESKCKG